MDVLNAPLKMVGAMTVRVPLMEILSVGAKIIAISNAVCNEMNPTAKEIIEGIEEELKRAGINNVSINGSTEENFITKMTALGITVIGIADNLHISKPEVGDYIILIGQPLVGEEILHSGKKTADYQDIYHLLNNKSVKEIIPVGSKGIFYEANNICKMHGLSLKVFNSGIDIYKSSGPSTCVIAVVNEKFLKSDTLLIGKVAI